MLVIKGDCSTTYDTFARHHIYKPNIKNMASSLVYQPDLYPNTVNNLLKSDPRHLKYFEREGRPPPKLSYEDGVIMSNPSNPTSLHFPPTQKMNDPLRRLIDTKEKSSRTHVNENFWLVQIRLDNQKA